MRILPDSPATPALPISMLLLPVVKFKPALKPIAMLLLPVVLLTSASTPSAVLDVPVVLLRSDCLSDLLGGFACNATRRLIFLDTKRATNA
jgi:hypothetical protein